MVRICQPLISHSIAALLPALLLYSYLIREVHLSNASANQNVQAFDGPPPLALSPASGGTAASAVETIGYAISLVKCSDFQTSAAGLIDAALVMRHSIHKTSIRNPQSGSKYDYRMYAIVHRQAEPCSTVLRDAGFEIVLVDPPVLQNEIRGEHLRKNIHKEWCCGSDEFIKLYTYTKIPHPVVVHVDIDFVFLKPMDELFDAMLFDKDSPEGQAARKSIPIERPEENRVLPDKIDAFLTKDWPQVVPYSGRKPGFQAGWLVVRPNQTVFDEVVEIIKEGNYTGGWGFNSGWSGQGYGAFVGAMAMQGLMMYYYDIVRPETFVEVNQCRYNWMGMDIKYNAHPNFHPKRKRAHGKCRNSKPNCEDCMHTSIDLIKNIHFTQCRKPWNCVGEGQAQNVPKKDKIKGLIDTSAGNLDVCLKVVKLWHELRTDFEDKMYNLTKDKRIIETRNGNYMPEVFNGHCDKLFKYKKIEAEDSSFKLVPKLYDEL